MAAVKQVNPNFFLDLVIPEGLVYMNGSPATSFTEANGPQVYLALYTTAPTATSNGTEVSGTGYARIPVWISRWVYTSVSGGVPTGVGYLTSGKSLIPSGRNSSPVSINAQDSYNTATSNWYRAGHTFTAGGSWGSVVAWGLCTASTGGSICMWELFDTPMTIGNGDTITFPPHNAMPVGTPGLEIDYFGIYCGADYVDNPLSGSPSSSNSRIQASRAASVLDTMLPTATSKMKLYSSMPTDVTNGLSVGTEITGGGYVEQSVVWTGNASTSFPASKVMADPVVFECSSGSWSVAGFAIVDPVKPTALRYAQRFTAPVTVNAGQQIAIDPVTVRLY